MRGALLAAGYWLLAPDRKAKRASPSLAAGAKVPKRTDQPAASGQPPVAGLHTDRHPVCVPQGMARTSTFLLAGLAVLTMGFAQSDRPTEPVPVPKAASHPLRSLEHSAFKPGEKLSYVLHYGFVNAGVATMELKEEAKDMNGGKILHARGEGHSVGAFKAFYKVDDLYESRFDRDGVFPWVFTRRCDEGGYIINQDYMYLQHRRQVTTQEHKTYDVPAHIQDMISAFYYARTWDLRNVQVGQEFTVDVFIDNEVWPLKMKFVGRETIKVRSGKYRCLKFQPMVQKGRIFKSNDDLNVWITDDGNKIPVLAQAKILVGSIKMELTGYEGLANPIAKVER